MSGATPTFRNEGLCIHLWCYTCFTCLSLCVHMSCATPTSPWLSVLMSGACTCFTLYLSVLISGAAPASHCMYVCIVVGSLGTGGDSDADYSDDDDDQGSETNGSDDGGLHGPSDGRGR